MRIVKRIICLYLSLVCVLLTGCNSVIYNGNFHVKNYEPETLADSPSAVVESSIKKAEEQDEDEKYNIEGTDAFYILPNHGNRPDQIMDFRVLDYVKDEGLIYCYQTPYYGSGKTGDVGVTDTSGTAPAQWTPMETKSTNLQVTVLMSYHPESRKYKVFFSTIGQIDTTGTTSKEVDGQTLTASVSATGLMVHKLVKSHEYFLYVNNVGYLFNSQGEQLWTHDYGSAVSQEINRLKRRYWLYGYNIEITINDVVMDGYRYVYIPITLQYSTPESESQTNIDSLEENDSTLENSSRRVILSCCNLDIGTDQSDWNNPKSVLFKSTNENWKAQIDMWKEMDGKEVGSEEEYEEYISRCTMYNIKTGAYKGQDGETDVRDSFPVFSVSSLSGNALNMQMAYVKDLFQIEGRDLWRWMYDHLDELRTKVDVSLPRGFYWWEYMYWRHDLKSYLEWGGFWNRMSYYTREQWINLINAALVMRAEETATGEDPIIKPLMPGKWNGRMNGSPFSSSWDALEALFAYKTAVYNDGSQVSRYADIRIPNRYDYYDSKKRPDVKVIAYTDPDTETGSEKGAEISRTLRYYVDTTTTDEEGNTISEREWHEAIQTAAPTPMTYALVLPEKTEVYWVDSQETNDVVMPSGDFGAIYFRETSGPDASDENSRSSITYEDGIAAALVDTNVKGKAVDAGDFYFGDQEAVVFITSTGVKFYRRNGAAFNVQGARYIALEDLARTTGYSLAALGVETYIQSVNPDEVKGVTAEQDAIMDKKIDKGQATEILSAANFTMLNQREMVLASLYNGLVLCNMTNGLTVSLEDGSYYASFPMEGDESGGSRFMVIGYRTGEYYYQPGDIVRAKCYDMDLAAGSAKLQSQAVKAYLDSMANAYITLTHRVAYEGNVAKPAVPDSGEKEDISKAEKLFIADENTALGQLRTLMSNLGFGSPDKEIKEYLAQLRQMFKNQRDALTVLYRLSGVGAITQIPADGELLKLEGQMTQAGYAANIESALVELALTDRAVEAMPEEQKEQYRKYQEQKKALELSGQNMNIMDEVRTYNAAKKEEEEQAKDAGQKEEQTKAAGQEEEQTKAAKREIEESEFYRRVLEDLKERFETGNYGSGEGQDWDSFMKEMLKKVSPYRTVNHQEEGLEEFRRITGLTEAICPDSSKLLRDISSVNRIWDLEELIVEYKVENLPAAYQSTDYKREFEAYRAQSFSTRKEQRAAFITSKFYKIIKDLKDAQDNQTKMSRDEYWDELLGDILKKCGTGIVLPEEYPEEK